MDFIEKMNEMFDWNRYTDDGRVVIDYAENCKVVVVKVLDKVETINVSDLTEYGAMFAIMDKVKEMYDEDPVSNMTLIQEMSTEMYE